MNFRLCFTIALLFVGTCAGQTFFPRKDLIFGQVAVGDSIEAQITVTNRGVFTYSGTLFFRKGQGENWNPIVDGTMVSAGKRTIQLLPGETTTLKLTGSGLQSGTVMLISEDLVLDNFIEGSLTYFFKSGNNITDSVGIASSQEVYFATLPFEDFSSVGLALANGNVNFDSDLTGRSDANVTLRLYDADDNLVATSNDPLLSPMVPMAHLAKFLREYFPAGTQLGRGKVEIISDVPIYGTALTFLFVQSGTQSSSLPLEPSPITYSIRMDSESDDVLEGDLSLWAEGYFIKGYLVVNFVNGLEVQDKVLTLVNGQLIDGILELSFYAQGEPYQVLDDEVSLVLEILGGFSFLPAMDTFAGSFVMTSLINPSATLAGSFSLDRLD
jgi:hypothetical protein